jgi:hypothetical protein
MLGISGKLSYLLKRCQLDLAFAHYLRKDVCICFQFQRKGAQKDNQSNIVFAPFLRSIDLLSALFVPRSSPFFRAMPEMFRKTFLKNVFLNITGK